MPRGRQPPGQNDEYSSRIADVCRLRPPAFYTIFATTKLSTMVMARRERTFRLDMRWGAMNTCPRNGRLFALPLRTVLPARLGRPHHYCPCPCPYHSLSGVATFSCAGGQPVRSSGPGKFEEISAGKRRRQVQFLHEGQRSWSCRICESRADVSEKPPASSSSAAISILVLLYPYLLRNVISNL